MAGVNCDNEEYDKRAHASLLLSIEGLQKLQHIDRPKRTEPTLRKSEFNLIKQSLSKVDELSDCDDDTVFTKSEKSKNLETVSIEEIVGLLKKKKTHKHIGKQLVNMKNTTNVLCKPLEKPELERMERAIGYEKTKIHLSRWDAIVTKNRADDHLIFPLKHQGNHTVSNKDINASDVHVKSDLMLAMAAIDVSTSNGKKIDEELREQKLTRQEMISRSNELRMFRIRESQQKVKARMHKKIKSKTFHKIMKREKLKVQLKEFEILQKVNPEAALHKLEQLDKHRIVERANLRHKNTGTWAKSLQVRAKFDKDVRKELSQQLSISRELTQKKQMINNDDSDDDNDLKSNDSGNIVKSIPNNLNPWIKPAANEPILNEVDQFNYLKNFKNKRTNINFIDSENDAKKTQSIKETKFELIKSTSRITPTSSTNLIDNGWVITYNPCNKKLPLQDKKKIKNSKIKNRKNIDSIDDLFDEAEDQIRSKVVTKTDELKSSLKLHPKTNRNIKKTGYKPDVDLSFKTIVKRPKIDAGLQHEIQLNKIDEIDNIHKLRNMQTDKHNPTLTVIDNINPNNFFTTKIQNLNTAIPDQFCVDLNIGGSDDDVSAIRQQIIHSNKDMELEKRLTISEAFEDDDIVADFERDKVVENRKDQPVDLELTLPGWGSWAGTGLRSRNTKRLILQFPKEEKRRDDNLGNVIIKEEINSKLRKHLVSDLPFPFTSVKDFECSIRAPIGTTFVTPSANKLLTRPAVITKLGKIIEPMEEEILYQKRMHGYRTKTALRIENLNGMIQL